MGDSLSRTASYDKEKAQNLPSVNQDAKMRYG